MCRVQFHVGLSGLWDVGKREGDPISYKVYRPGVGTLTLQGTAKQWYDHSGTSEIGQRVEGSGVM